MKALKRVARSLGAAALVLAVAATTIVATALPAEAAVVRPFALNYNAEVFGDFILAGNGNSACPGASNPTDPFGEPKTGCAPAQDRTNVTAAGINDSYYMTWSDVDSNAATYNSSTASVTIPSGATVAYARLTWSGDTGTIRLADGTVSALPGCNTRQFLAGAGTAVLPSGTPESTSTRFTVGGAATAAVAPQVISRDALANVPASQPQFYSAYANVTSQFAGAATGAPLQLSLGNVWTPQGFGCYSGWSLALVYSYPEANVNAPSKKKVFIYDGHVRQSSTDPTTTINPSGFRAAGTAARVGITGFEGDFNIAGDQFLVNGASVAEPNTASTTNFFNSSTDFAVNPAVSNNMSIDAKTVDVAIPAGATSAALSFATSGDTFLAANVAVSVPIASLHVTTTASPIGPYRVGDAITHTVSVTSHGGAAAGITVDSTVDDCDRSLGNLGAGASVMYTCTGFAVADETVTTNASALDAFGAPLFAAASTTIDVINPAVEITATADRPSYAVGDTITFTIRVANTGDTPLTNVVVTDTAVPSCANTTATLAVGGAVLEYTCTATAPIVGHSNTASVVANYSATSTVNDSSTVPIPTNGVISGRVFADRNNNGAVDSGEHGIRGVTIILSGSTAGGTPVNRVAFTDALGNYAFADVPAGNYLVSETQPSDYDDGIDTAGSNALASGSDIVSVTLASAESSTGTLFAERPTSSLAGAVYLDANSNGARDTGEPGLAGVTVTLGGQDSDGNAVSYTAVTAAGTGAYLFSGLRPGTYQLVESQPAGYGTGTDSIGTAGGAAASANTVTDIALAARTNATGYLFGETTGALSGAVYADLDGDGVRSLGELGVGGVVVTLTGTDSSGAITPIATLSSSDGSYAFTGLLAGDYVITETQTLAYGIGTGTVGTAGGTAGANVFSAISLAAGASASGYLFGQTPASITGAVFHDVDANGAQGASDPGLSGLTVTLAGTDFFGKAVTLSSSTVVDGGFSFTGLLAGNYSITAAQPGGFADGAQIIGSAGGSASSPRTIAGIELDGGESASGYLFGNQRGSVSGKVWLDSNGDGVADAAEPGASGVTVGLYSAGSLIATVQSASDGSYSFGDLPSGSYQIGVDPGASHVLTVPGQGSGQTGSDVDWLSGLSDEFVIDMAGGQSTARTHIDAGIALRNDDLGVVLSAENARVSVGSAVKFTATVTNRGNTPAAGASVAITVPDGVRLDTVSGVRANARAAAAGWSCTTSAQTVTCTSADVVLPGESFLPVTVSGVALAAGSGSASASVAFVDGTVNGGQPNNASSEPITIAAVVIPPTTPPTTPAPTTPPTAPATPSSSQTATPLASNGALPTTGFGLGPAVGAGVLLLLGGALVVAFRRRREDRSAS